MSILASEAPTVDDGLVLLANESMRARRRPAVVLALWVWQAAIALVVAWPTAAAVRSMYGDHPRGDGPLWDRGGHALVDAFMQAQHATPIAVSLSVVALAIAAVLGLVPLAGALASIAYTRAKPIVAAPRIGDVAGRAARAFWPMALTLLMVTIVQALALGAGLMLGGVTTSALEPSLGEARAEQVGWVVLLAFGVVAAACGVVHDLARAAIVRFRVGPIAGVRLGFGAFRRAPVATVWSWAWRSGAALVPIAVGAFVAERLGGRAGNALVALFLIHQLVIAARVALHASWLATTLRAVDRAHRVARTSPEATTHDGSRGAAS